jgi:hypothetical protein
MSNTVYARDPSGNPIELQAGANSTCTMAINWQEDVQ